tara:strand:+ start:1493 stop:2497 length:1005 start_codon:yes stop_codon:yes gene_type:complete
MIRKKSLNYLIITTINEYKNTSIKEYSKYDYNIVIVGDLKTPHNTYLNDNLKYINPKDELFSNFSKLLPFNHYCRKNLGYLYAINNNANLIFDTDDDNYPLSNFNSWNKIIDKSQTIINPKFPNVMSLFTKKNIWPRGYPLELIKKKQPIKLQNSTVNERKRIGIIQSLAQGDPDVDAIYRLTNENYNDEIMFDKNKSFILQTKIYTQGNTQATLWVDKDIFHLLYIPCTVSFRFCDILKMYIAQKCIWEYNKLFCYISPIVMQDRNDHNFMDDFKSEFSMYISVLNIINNIFENIKLNGNKNDLFIIYEKLYENNIVKELELKLIREWLNYLN